jgi:FKBP-type peptidyl-prolyl cis-trans isomerase
MDRARDMLVSILVAPKDRIAFAEDLQTSGTSSFMETAKPLAPDPNKFEIYNLNRVNDGIPSRAGDLLEIEYEAHMYSVKGPVYDSSAQRGTGQPYLCVLGSGDMLPGVDAGLVNMRPGEVRQLQIPSALAYGAKGNRLFKIPGNTNLVWIVRMVSVNSVRESKAEESQNESN